MLEPASAVFFFYDAHAVKLPSKYLLIPYKSVLLTNFVRDAFLTVCSSLYYTGHLYEPLSPKIQEIAWKSRQKECKGQKMGEKYCLLDMTCCWTHELLISTCTRSSQSTFQHA